MDIEEFIQIKNVDLSFCIPTYNRARYLDCLLEVFLKTSEKLSFEYEIIISNNASTDDTDAIIQKYINYLPIKYFKQKFNIGAEKNLKFAAKHASGELLMYLADDDLFELNGLNSSVNKMLNNPDAAIIYAPWIIKSLIGEHDDILFYQTDDVSISKNDYLSLAKHIIYNNIWSEIFIARTSFYNSCNAIQGKLAYWAFTMPCEYINFGNIIYSSEPFYISISSYFKDEVREQAGHEETEYAWDRYRGGLEFLLGRCINSLNKQEEIYLRKKIDQIILDRMIVALRLRINTNKDPCESYQLASRIRGLGGEAFLPLDMLQLRSMAILYYLTNDGNLLENIQNIYLLGDYDESIILEIKSLSNLNVQSGMDLSMIDLNTLVLLKGNLVVDLDLHESIRVVSESQLLEKFF
jgi:glycosyltransferase involved in cell wall biosynthesis